MNEYYYIDDGYAIVGVGYRCSKCGRENNFVSGDMDEQRCKHCKHINHMIPKDDY